MKNGVVGLHPPLGGGAARSAGVGVSATCSRSERTKSIRRSQRRAVSSSPRIAPEFCGEFAALESRGRREGRMQGLHPWPACNKKAGGSHHRWAEQPAFPARWFDGLYVVSSGTGLIAPVASNALSASSPTWPQHREARTARFHRRIGYVRPREQTHAATRRAHRIPHPTSVTIAKRPLIRGGMARSKARFLKKRKKEFLCVCRTAASC
jgi:hypothetical protein